MRKVTRSKQSMRSRIINGEDTVKTLNKNVNNYQLIKLSKKK